MIDCSPLFEKMAERNLKRKQLDLEAVVSEATLSRFRCGNDIKMANVLDCKVDNSINNIS